MRVDAAHPPSRRLAELPGKAENAPAAAGFARRAVQPATKSRIIVQ